MTTIVTALLTNINNHRSIDKYIEYGIKLINIPKHKLIYIEKEIYDTYYKDIYPCYNNENIETNTSFRFIEKNDIYLYKYYDKITNFDIITDNPSKDNIDYMFVQCSKTEWIRHAIQENPYNSQQFIWIDYGIYHMINNDEEFEKCIYNISNKHYDNIRIASGFFNGNDAFIYKSIIWFFLGSIFGGDKDKLLIFADLMKEKCISIIENEKTICWEINIWYQIYKENPELFLRYLAGHNPSILMNY